jgi:hypothetical protein
MAASTVRLMADEIDSDHSDADHDGECVICGRYRRQIAAGTIKPCWQWQRVKETDDDTTDA